MSNEFLIFSLTANSFSHFFTLNLTTLFLSLLSLLVAGGKTVGQGEERLSEERQGRGCARASKRVRSVERVDVSE